MKKIIISILAVLAFSWISAVSAGEYPSKGSPESVVTCGVNLGQIISIASVPETINVEQCTPWVDSCATCVISLENQGCGVVDVVVTHFRHPEGPPVFTGTTYLLSCVEP
jgi:hypothetical protein